MLLCTRIHTHLRGRGGTTLRSQRDRSLNPGFAFTTLLLCGLACVLPFRASVSLSYRQVSGGTVKWGWFLPERRVVRIKGANEWMGPVHSKRAAGVSRRNPCLGPACDCNCKATKRAPIHSLRPWVPESGGPPAQAHTCACTQGLLCVSPLFARAA